MKTLYWHRNDLRLLDNEILATLSAKNSQILPVFIFDPAHYKMLDIDFRKTGIHRYRYLVQTLQSLRDQYRSYGGDLMIALGNPADVIKQLVEKHDIKEVYVQKELANEEASDEEKVEAQLKPLDVNLHRVWGRTLFHIDDIPYGQHNIPLTSKTFRINTTKAASPRPIIPKPEKINFLQIAAWGDLPTPETLGFQSHEIAEPQQGIYGAGESAALERLNYYTFESELIKSYKWTRNRSLGMDYSSKLSPYLALGSISPRVIYWKVKEYEKEVKRNISTWWLIFELIWRDYFCFSSWRHGNKMFHKGGIKDRDTEWKYDRKLFEKWKSGTTGIPFLDAHMKELASTGFMSNRGRVNAASFLARDYQIDWRWGAAWFENRLIDYDVSSNWMNWNTQATEIWHTNPVHQAMKYDKKGDYTLKWNPELRALPAPKYHAPWKFTDEELASYGVKNYHRPVEIYAKWSRAINNIWK